MIQRRGKRKRPSPLERLEQRSVPTTLVALIDTGVDETSSGASDSPYYDFTYAYDAENKQTAAQYGNGVVSDNSGLTHGHGSTVADFIVQGISNTSGQQGASAASVKIMPIRDTFISGQYTGQLDPNAIIRGIYWAADHGAAVINMRTSLYRWLSKPFVASLHGNRATPKPARAGRGRRGSGAGPSGRSRATPSRFGRRRKFRGGPSILGLTGGGKSFQ